MGGRAFDTELLVSCFPAGRSVSLCVVLRDRGGFAGGEDSFLSQVVESEFWDADADKDWERDEWLAEAVEGGLSLSGVGLGSRLPVDGGFGLRTGLVAIRGLGLRPGVVPVAPLESAGKWSDE